MAHLIDKDALVAEIERRKNENQQICTDEGSGAFYEDGFILDIINFLDTLEVKEVDLHKSARHYLLYEHISPLNEVLHHVDIKVEMQYHKDIEDAYKAGFELGLKAQKGE